MSKKNNKSVTADASNNKQKKGTGIIKAVNLVKMTNGTVDDLDQVKDLIGIKNVLLGSTYTEAGRHSGVMVSVSSGLVVTSSNLLRNAMLSIGNEVISVKDEFDYAGLIAAYTGKVGVLSLQQRIIAQPISLPLMNYGQQDVSLLPYLVPTQYNVGGQWRTGYVCASCMPVRLPRITLAYVGGCKSLVVRHCNVTVYERA